MCATACESRSTCCFKSSHAHCKPIYVGVPAGQGLWPDSGPLGPRFRRLMRKKEKRLYPHFGISL